METPVFEEFDPAKDCECPGCVHWRRVLPRSRAHGGVGRPTTRHALVLAAAAGTALCAGHAVPAVAAAHGPVVPGIPADDGPDTPQGPEAPLHGATGQPTPDGPDSDTAELPSITRAEIINRAKRWVAAQVPYSMTSYWSDGYRQDCSGFVSMAWNLGRNEWTGSLGTYGVRISKDELQPGDMLLFHNPADPQNGSHVVIFGGWTDSTRAYYVAYESTRPYARRQVTPYAYWKNSSRYVPYRYKGVAAGNAGAEPEEPREADEFPGTVYFGPGANNAYVTRLGRMLVQRGASSFYTTGPGPVWTEADRRATKAFQEAQGWTGAAADGLPGPTTWEYLVEGVGRDIPAAGSPGAPGRTGSHGVDGYPGRGMFRPGMNNPHVTELGRQLVRKGFGKHYAVGPGPRWTEADRRNVEAFQRAQGWRGRAADGYPGPETWRRLFS
ncbi:peptidoglycan-binding protein [Streptomyces sp. NPDC046862]|uniref:peptidoglycan-binding protein n=1 Tax=Streptomyces sp. NPDC046862 TaxID=3154603 RepID=UPI00345403D4